MPSFRGRGNAREGCSLRAQHQQDKKLRRQHQRRREKGEGHCPVQLGLSKHNLEQIFEVLGDRLISFQRKSLVDSGASLCPTGKGKYLVVLLRCLGRNIPRSVAVALAALRWQFLAIGAGGVVEQLKMFNLDLFFPGQPEVDNSGELGCGGEGNDLWKDFLGWMPSNQNVHCEFVDKRNYRLRVESGFREGKCLGYLISASNFVH